jgi:hypothetical protein
LARSAAGRLANGDMTDLPGVFSSDPGKRLGIYLSDHLAGATTGIELARRAASNNRGNEFGPVLAQIAEDIEEDIESLKELMTSVGAGRDRLKEGLAWSGEKLGRLKLNGQVLGYSPLSRLIELEGLTLGVSGKLALWRAIKEVFGGDPRLSGFDLDRLIGRAEEQRATLEECRLKAARVAFETETVPR